MQDAGSQLLAAIKFTWRVSKHRCAQPAPETEIGPGICVFVLVFFKSYSGDTSTNSGLGRAGMGLLQTAPGHLSSGTPSLLSACLQELTPSKGSVCVGAGGR